MDALPQLLPLGGASAVFIILLRILLHERSQWVRERAELIAEHRADIEEMERRHKKTTEFFEGMEKSMTDRIKALESEVARLRDELHVALGGDGRGTA